MTITVPDEFFNSKELNFSKLVEKTYRFVQEIGQEIVREVLEEKDKQILAEQTNKRYRCKGKRKTSIKTILGTIEYKRRIYLDKGAETPKHVYLLDQHLKIDKVGAVEKGMCEIVASAICGSTYREASNCISKIPGMNLSPQGVWNIVQKIGTMREETVKRYAEIAKLHQGKGKVQAPILYEEDDGIYLQLQGKSRKENGPKKEMKVGIAYDGTVVEKDRRILDNKLAYATFDTVKNYREKKEGIVQNFYDGDSVQLRVRNGDGAGWVRGKNDDENIFVLDEFHRNKILREKIHNPCAIQAIQAFLRKKEIDNMFEYLEALRDSVEPEEQENVECVLKYYRDNQDSLIGYMERGIELPETRDPEKVQYANLGSMESNVFTLIGNRMKNRRRCWSIEGANNLAQILCMYYTSGFESIFQSLPSYQVVEETPWNDPYPKPSYSRINLYDGKGYEYPKQFDTSTSGIWLTKLVRNLSKKL